MLSNDCKIIQYPNLILYQVSEEVNKTYFNGSELSRIVEEMRIIKCGQGALGLAAIQIGLTKRIILVDEIAMINPKIIMAENEIETEESCLSIRGNISKKKRFDKVRASA